MNKKLLSFLLFISLPIAQAAIKSAKAISEPSGDGQQYQSIVLEYSELFRADELPSSDHFHIKNHQIEKISLGKCIDKRKICRSTELVLHLSKNSDNHHLKVAAQPSAKSKNIKNQPVFHIEQINSIFAEQQNKRIEIKPSSIETDQIQHLIVEDFSQREFIAQNGTTVKYNLFIPKNYNPKKRYPLVLFLHDNASTNSNVKHTLWQGNGATSWAAPNFQQKYPAFILAPQFETTITNKHFNEPSELELTINLINALSEEYHIDSNRLYAIGQSTGAMLAMAMNIKYPDMFAASYIVAGYWAIEKVAPMARTKQFILVSEDDSNTFHQQNAIVEELALNGAQVQKAILQNGSADINALNQNVDSLLERYGNIYYMIIKSKTLPAHKRESDSKNLEQAHNATWKIAYDIPAIKEWLLAQSR